MNNKMNIIVFGAAGDVGQRIVNEAVARNHNTTAIIRRPVKPNTFPDSVDCASRDVLSATDLKELIARHDLVISTLRPSNGQENMLTKLTEKIVDAALATSTRFIVVGGAACLAVPNTDNHTVLTAPDFLPAEYVPIATACQQQHDNILPRLNPRGVYIAPPAVLIPGERTQSYRLGTDTLLVDDEGNSSISMEDFAHAILNEVESPMHQGTKFTVAY
jgi:putative NADH-flavin reductase